jgi:uncharacterized protein (UPF0332 family)
MENKEAINIYIQGARDALKSAQYNLDGGYYRVAANRGYYAFFYAATALLMTLNISRGKHSGVLAAFREIFVKTGLFPTEDSITFGEAFELRNTSDYDILGSIDLEDAQNVIQNAKDFLERCEEYLN